jgi:hypothetical protein
MPVEYEINSEAQLLTLTAIGEVTLDEESDCFARWSGDPHYHKAMPILLDNRERTTEASSDHVRKVAGLAEKNQEIIGEARCAIVVSSHVEYGMARMFSLISDSEPMAVKVFRDIAEARQWLLSDA